MGVLNSRTLAVVLALGGLVVLMAHPGLYLRNTAYMAVLISYAFLCFGLAVSTHSSPPRPPRFLLGSMLLFLAIALASLWGNGHVLGWSLWWPLSHFLLVWAGWRVAADRVALRILAYALSLGAALVCVYAFVQSSGLDPLPIATPFEGRRIVSTFENPNYLGNFAAFALPLLAAFFLGAAHWKSRLVLGIIVSLAYGACILAGSRGAWLAGFAGITILVVGVLYALRARTLQLHWPSLVLLAIALSATTVFATRAPVIANSRGEVSVGQRLLSSRYIIAPHERGEPTSEAAAATSVRLGEVQVQDTTINHRYFIWRVAWAMVLDQPLLGVGYGEFAARFPHYRDAQRGDSWYASLIETQQYENTRYAHNEYLHLWAECGLLGLCAFFLLQGSVWCGLVQRLWHGAPLELWGIAAALLVMLVHSLVSYPLRLPLNGMLFWLCMGIAARYCNSSKY
jgi:putative inorganic carbon (hco3(-)) transporter